ncbi:16S rRNA (adenine(1518)-N(6)/adenine(1519)-N(6))-dimethyltransferase RsmA [Sandaracinobacteroides saxicola]|uniref:Ribosomal RNA small subunit methyltransferase A n=2 Tax=Sandaracinobacteroides saxicola TaxID=2759707 RepID=A0A7G5IMB7_9SPHN|nr:16S rRNA (adenine(1518)-N(6)/adenine(1519)-N(6))-dimethyltransferase RsmA [Sandaracinobacteroides saxicola]
MAALPPMRQVIEAAGLRASKALGQNFLLDLNLLDSIVRAMPIQPGDAVYEVGPGPGGLTRALLKAGARVTAVERDARALPILGDLAAVAPLTVIEGDALKQQPAALFPGGAHIAANLPYNIGTALLVGWLSEAQWLPWWRSATLMFQREVAERIVALPGSAAYGRLAVLAGWRSRARIVTTLPPAAFVPPPKVSSAVVQLLPKDPADGVAPGDLARVTAAAFGQRRKMLRAAMKSLPGGVEAIEAAGLDGTRRAETLDIAEFVTLTKAWQKG